MKCFVISFLSVIILNCKPQKATISNTFQTVLTTDCPQDGTCTFEVLDNKSLKTLKSDLGEVYTQIIDDESLVVKFEYKRNEIPNTLDGHYIEQVFIELDKNNLELELSDSALKKVKVMFARFCYCKGQTGYYRVSQGKLSVKKIDDKTYQLDLVFKQDEVPQIISGINEKFTLE